MSRKFDALGAELPDLLAGLFERAADNLTEADLQHLAAYPEVAHNMVSRMAEVCTGIACLVQSDDPKNGGNNIGNFQESVSSSSLLFMLADVARQAEAFMTVAERARAALQMRRPSVFSDFGLDPEQGHSPEAAAVASGAPRVVADCGMSTPAARSDGHVRRRRRAEPAAMKRAAVGLVAEGRAAP